MIDPVATSKWSARETEGLQEAVRPGGETQAPRSRARSVEVFPPHGTMVSRRLLALIAFLAGMTVGIVSCVRVMGELQKRAASFRWP